MAQVSESTRGSQGIWKHCPWYKSLKPLLVAPHSQLQGLILHDSLLAHPSEDPVSLYGDGLGTALPSPSPDLHSS